MVTLLQNLRGRSIRLFAASSSQRNQIHSGRWDLGTSALASAIVAQFFTDHLEKHLEKTNLVVKAKCQAVLDTLDSNVSDLCSWTKPRGGLFLWIEPSKSDMNKLRKLAGQKGIGFSH